jgi:hypothetical protein
MGCTRARPSKGTPTRGASEPNAAFHPSRSKLKRCNKVTQRCKAARFVVYTSVCTSLNPFTLTIQRASALISVSVLLTWLRTSPGT